MLTLKLNMIRSQPSRYRMKGEQTKKKLLSDHRAVCGMSDMSLWEFSLSVLRRPTAAKDPSAIEHAPTDESR